MSESQTNMLFPIDELPARPSKPFQSRATPADPGSGPAGETCQTCLNYMRVKYRDYVYRKCGLMRDSWTHGQATDIRASWPACAKWEAKL